MRDFFNMFSIADIGIVGHLQTVGHVAGEADVEDGTLATSGPVCQAKALPGSKITFRCG